MHLTQRFAKWGKSLIPWQADGSERRMALQELAGHSGVSYVALKKAAQQERLDADKSGKVWLSTPAAVERAIEAGRLRRKA